MAIQLNSFGNCTTDLRGTGTRSCDIQTFGDVLGIALLQKGVSFNVLTDTLNDALWLARLKAFQLFPFLGVYNFEQTTPDNEINTSSTGVLAKVRNGKPQFTFSFDKGGCFHKALYDKSGKSRWDVAMLFDKGLLMASNQASTAIKGFNMGLFDVETFKLVQGTDPQMSMAKIQLLDAEEFNQRFEFFTWEQLGFNALEVNGVVDTTVKVDTPVTDGDTTVVVSVANACNVDDVILGLDSETNWALGGVQAVDRTVSSVTFDADTLKYTLTLSGALAEADTIQPRLVSGATSVAEDSDDNLFKGQSVLITVAAAPSV